MAGAAVVVSSAKQLLAQIMPPADRERVLKKGKDSTRPFARSSLQSVSYSFLREFDPLHATIFAPPARNVCRGSYRPPSYRVAFRRSCTFVPKCTDPSASVRPTERSYRKLQQHRLVLAAGHCFFFSRPAPSDKILLHPCRHPPTAVRFDEDAVSANGISFRAHLQGPADRPFLPLLLAHVPNEYDKLPDPFIGNEGDAP